MRLRLIQHSQKSALGVSSWFRSQDSNTGSWCSSFQTDFSTSRSARGVVQARGSGGPTRVTVGRHGVLGAEQARRRSALIIARVKAGDARCLRQHRLVSHLTPFRALASMESPLRAPPFIVRTSSRHIKDNCTGGTRRASVTAHAFALVTNRRLTDVSCLRRTSSRLCDERHRRTPVKHQAGRGRSCPASQLCRLETVSTCGSIPARRSVSLSKPARSGHTESRAGLHLPATFIAIARDFLLRWWGWSVPLR